MARAVLLSSFLALLTGCGFQLRSYDLDANVESYAVTGMLRAPIVAPLRQALRQAGVPEAPANEAKMIVEILDQRNRRRSVSTAGQAQAAEYEVDFAVEYQLKGENGVILAEPIWVERQRIYRIDRDNIVGSNEEQSILQRELMQEVVGQIVRAINLVSRPPEEVVVDSTGEDAT